MNSIKSLLAASMLTAAGAANATVWDVEMHVDTTLLSTSGYSGDPSLHAVGNLTENFLGTWNDSTGAGSWHGSSQFVSTPDPVTYTATYTQTFTMHYATGAGSLKSLDQSTCTDPSGGSGCAAFSSLFIGNTSNNNGDTFTDYKSKQPFTPIDGGMYQWTLQIVFLSLNWCDENGCAESQYIPVPMQVTLHSQVPLPAAAWLFGSGLLGVTGVARRKYK